MSELSKDEDISSICCADTRDGMISFCESMKVDFSTAGNHAKEVLTSTLSLVNVVLESFLNIPDSFEKGIPDSMLPLDVQPLTQTLILTQKRPTNSGDKAFFHRLDDFSFDKLSAVDIDELRLYEAMCRFGQNEYVKNLVCVLEHICKKVYGNDKDILGQLLKALSLDTTEVKSLTNLRFQRKETFPPNCYAMRFTNEDVVIRSTVARPQQFRLGTLNTMTSLLDKVGIGWDDIDVDEYFKTSMGGREDVLMTNSK